MLTSKQSGNLTFLAVGMAVGLLTYFVGSSLYNPPQPRRLVAPDGFFLGVKVIFPNEYDKMEFRTEFEKLAIYVRDHEPKTISYELLQSDKEPLQIFILERYLDKSAYLDIHKQSKEFISFRAKFQKMIERGAKIDGDSYLETGVGFV
eukprot:gene8274-9840_t